jgi:class 3 adenylate cyclase/tetratricopeptide (TPR) repeat protein
MNCAACGTENRPDRRFCRQCGLPLANICGVCSAGNEPGDRFCGNCGTTLGSAEAAPAQAAVEPASGPTTERRFVSVLFLDLVGFTALAESRDPEEVQTLQRRYFDLARDVIGRYGGTVEKFIGDAVMAVWGTPVAFEDDPERAVRAALDLVGSVAGLDTGDPNLHLQARAAVLSGDAAVSLGVTGQGMVSGDLVNTASRLQGAAAAGSVLVGDATRRATEAAISYESVGSATLKGKQEGVDAWRAVAVLAGRGGAGRAEVLEPPFVGRDSEFRMLKELLHATGGERRARLISITGIAGIGKSRLAWELDKYIDGIAEDIYWHQGRSPAYGEGVAFWALGEMVRARAGIAETDAQPVARERLEATIADFVPDAEERRWLGPRLAALLGLEEMPATERADLFAAWRTFFERVSDRGTTILVFEDLQWADQGLFDFIEAMLEWSRAHPILIVTLARPEVTERRPTWGAGQRNFAALHLEPLPDATIGELLVGLAPGIPEAMLARIVARAEGVPLYAVETVRMLVGRGELVADEAGAYQMVGDPATLEVPETLRGLIAARLDALEPADRSLVQDASVLGLSFTPAALAAISGAQPAAVEAGLGRLVRREVLRLDADPRSPERGQYAFVQGLLQEVAYGTLARPERRARHLAAVRFFEATGNEEIAAIVADHYLLAFRATPPGPEADALAAQARLALRAAGERSAALHSHLQAIGFFERALEVTPESVERAVLHERAGEAARAGADYQPAERHLVEAVAAYRGISDLSGLARSAAALGRVLHAQSAIERSVALLEPMLPEVGGLGDDAGLAAFLAELARAYMFVARTDLGLPIVDRGLAMAERLELIAVIADAMVTKGNLLEEAGRPREATALTRGAASLAQANGLPAIQVRALNNLVVRLWVEDPRESWSVALEAVDVARRIGDREWLLGTVGFAGSFATNLGRWDEALAMIDEADRPDLPASDRVAFAGIRLTILAYRGEVEAAQAIFDEVAPLRGLLGRQEDAAFPHFERSVILWSRGRDAEALTEAMEGSALAPSVALWGAWTAAPAAFALRDVAALRQVVDVADGAWDRGRYVAALRRYLHGGLAILEGRVEAGIHDVLAAAGYMRECDARLDLLLTLLGLVLVAPPDHPAVPDAVLEARAIIEALGARAIGESLERAAPRVASGATAT